MRIVQTAVAALLMGVVSLELNAQVPSPVTPTTQQPGPPVAQPAPPAPQTPAPGAPPVPTAILPPVPVAPILPRSFTAKAGVMFNAVRPERAVDFEVVLGLFKDALQQSTDPAVRAQAAGWRVFKATEPGPNATVLYVFVVDPAIPGADYGLGRILSEAYPDRIQEIWKLYTGALAGGGSLLNLSPVEPPPATLDTPTIAEPATTVPGGRGAPPAGQGTAVPAGRGAPPPAGREAPPPAGRGAPPPAGPGTTQPEGRGTVPARPAPPTP